MARFNQGDFQVSVVSDGYISIPEDIFTADAQAAERSDVLKRMDVSASDVQAPTNIPVFKSRRDVILFDIGSGSRYQPSDGRFVENLGAEGIAPASVTKIVFTHAHPDHISATITETGELRFPEATYFVGSDEWNFWMDPDFFLKAPEAIHGFGRDARRDLSAIKDRAVFLRPGQEVVTGIRAIGTPGHTPGHLSFEVSGGDGLIITADAATSEVVAFEHPGWKFGYDVDPDLAISSRRRLIDRAARDKCRLLGFHWRYPGVGYADAVGDAYRFVPALP